MRCLAGMRGNLYLPSKTSSEDKGAEAYLCVSEKDKQSTIARIKDFLERCMVRVEVTNVSWD